ncbi:MAG: pilin [Candidatus Nomurabacteria bacterium]|jgi:hypothetical protein|nr:pilin [Candidatus Nomurabacteria bacterium]
MKRAILIFALVVGLAGALASGSVLAAGNEGYEICSKVSGSGSTVGCANKERDKNTLEDNLTGALGTAFMLVGALAVVMIIFGGIQYTTSGGDSSKTANAKRIIAYSIVGLAVALLGSAVVYFVVGNVI